MLCCCNKMSRAAGRMVVAYVVALLGQTVVSQCASGDVSLSDGSCAFRTIAMHSTQCRSSSEAEQNMCYAEYHLSQCLDGCAGRGRRPGQAVPLTMADNIALAALCGTTQSCWFGVGEYTPWPLMLRGDDDWHKMNDWSATSPLSQSDFMDWCPGEPDNGGGRTQMTAAYWRRQPEAGTEWGPGSTCWSDIHWSEFRTFRDDPSIGRTSHLLCACPAGPLSPPSSPPPSPPSSPPPPLLPPPDLTPVIIGAAGGGTVAILGVVIIIGVFYHCKCCKKKKPAAAADVR